MTTFHPQIYNDGATKSEVEASDVKTLREIDAEDAYPNGDIAAEPTRILAHADLRARDANRKNGKTYVWNRECEIVITINDRSVKCTKWGALGEP